jgi:hypothetical protein
VDSRAGRGEISGTQAHLANLFNLLLLTTSSKVSITLLLGHPADIRKVRAGSILLWPGIIIAIGDWDLGVTEARRVKAPRWDSRAFVLLIGSSIGLLLDGLLSSHGLLSTHRLVNHGLLHSNGLRCGGNGALGNVPVRYIPSVVFDSMLHFKCKRYHPYLQASPKKQRPINKFAMGIHIVIAIILKIMHDDILQPTVYVHCIGNENIPMDIAGFSTGGSRND